MNEQRIQAMLLKDALVGTCDEDTRARFEGLLERPQGAAGCWYFWGHLNPAGYGVFGFQGVHVMAHRMALIWAKGCAPIDKPIVCHQQSCAKNCVNPAHLRWGTPAENNADARTDENNYVREECDYAQKLSDDDIKTIWHRFYFEQATQEELSQHFGTAKSYISCIVRGIYRSHVTRELSKPKQKRVARIGAHGEAHGLSDLTEADVQAIRWRLSKGEPDTSIAKDYKMTGPAVRHIRVGRTWARLPWPDGCAAPSVIRAKLSDETVREIRRLAESGISLADIGRQFNMSYVSIGKIRDRKNYKDVQ